MVLLHSSWKYNGLAAAAMLMTVIVVFSGVIGRYIYTRIPRDVHGQELLAGLPPAAIANARRLLATWHTVHIPLGLVMFTIAFVHIAAALYFATFLH
jgi:cytochrome b561